MHFQNFDALLLVVFKSQDWRREAEVRESSEEDQSQSEHEHGTIVLPIVKCWFSGKRGSWSMWCFSDLTNQTALSEETSCHPVRPLIFASSIRCLGFQLELGTIFFLGGGPVKFWGEVKFWSEAKSSWTWNSWSLHPAFVVFTTGTLVKIWTRIHLWNRWSTERHPQKTLFDPFWR